MWEWMTTTSGLRSLPAIEKVGSDEVHGVQIGLSPPGLAPEPFGSVIHYKSLIARSALSGTGE